VLNHVPLQALVYPWKNALGTPQSGRAYKRCLPSWNYQFRSGQQPKPRNYFS